MPAARAGTTLPLADEPLCGPPLTEVPLSGDDAVSLAAVLAALADPVRLRLISILAAQGEVCSCHLQEPLGKSQPTISHHMAVLKEAGILRSEKRGLWHFYSLRDDLPAPVERLLGAFLPPV